jgi:Fe-S-cluster containining protein
MTTDHDFTRTKCACEGCIRCCKRQPGPLAPGDFERIAEHLGETREEAKQHFWASPGAIARFTQGGDAFRVGTITPRFRKGRCVFLDENDRCKIHPVAPFGCAYFDTHQGKATAVQRSIWLINAQANSKEYEQLRNELPYATHYKPSQY